MDGLVFRTYEQGVFHPNLVMYIDDDLRGVLGAGGGALVKDERRSCHRNIAAVFSQQCHILRDNDDLRDVIMPPHYLLSPNSK